MESWHHVSSSTIRCPKWEPLEPVPGGEEQALRAPCAADSQGGADTQADVQSLPVAEDATGVALCPVSDS